MFLGLQRNGSLTKFRCKNETLMNSLIKTFCEQLNPHIKMKKKCIGKLNVFIMEYIDKSWLATEHFKIAF